jgi:imidazolonepropionase-like amidohydrolase
MARAIDVLVADELFDGERRRAGGPFTLVVEGGRIRSVEPGDRTEGMPEALRRSAARVPFLMPGLVEAHAHLFLDGGVLDLAERSRYLKAGPDEMMSVGRANLRASLGCGVTLVRDAGDRFGVNHRLRGEAIAAGLPVVRSAGLGLRRPKQYGAFMAREVATDEEIVAAVREQARTADDVKLLATGIIDFDAGAVTAPPQFDAAALALAVRTARECGRPTFAHCSGVDGLEAAIEAGVDSIEHGFFINRDHLARMAGQGIAWVPTFAPVEFQHRAPGHARWRPETVAKLRDILESHREHVCLAVELGVPLVVGSDAGSHGVPHGAGLVHELGLVVNAGVSLEKALRAATTTQRRLWGAEEAALAPGAVADLVRLDASPFADLAALGSARALYRAGARV